MALAHVAARGTAADPGASTSLAVTPTGSIALGNLLIVRGVTYNAGTVSGPTTDHTSVTDTQGNTYTRLYEYTRSSGGVAGDGLTVSVWGSVLATALTTGDTVTLNLGASLSHRTVSLSEFTAVVPLIADADGADGLSTAPSVALAGMSSAPYLLIATTGYRRTGADTEGFDGNYTNDVTPFDTASGGNNARIKQWGEYRLATLTGDTYTSSNSVSGNWVAVLVALVEDAAPTYDAILKVWDGAAFTAPGGVVKVWDGAVWNTAVFKVYDGADFVIVTPSP